MGLTIKHLSAYLPYRLSILRPDNKTIIDVVGLCGNLYIFNEIGKNETYGSIKSSFNKPILRNLSDLTKEIEHNGTRFIPMEMLRKVFGFEYQITLKFDFKDDFGDYYEANELPYNIVQQLHEWHFDTQNLIENGLAIAVTDELNPYK